MTIDILVVEDNPGDVVFIRKAFAKSSLDSVLHVVSDGEQALKFIRGQDPFTGTPRPDLVLLDINLPRVNGLEVLKAVKEDDELRRIPVVMLTSSGRDEDVNAAYSHHANSYITKPESLRDLRDAVEQLEQYWFGVVRRPS